MNHSKIFSKKETYKPVLLKEVDAIKKESDELNEVSVWKDTEDFYDFKHTSQHAIEGNKLKQNDSQVLYDTYSAWKSEELIGITQDEFQKTLKSKLSSKHDCLEVLFHINASNLLKNCS